VLAAVDFIAQDVFEALTPAGDMLAVSIGDPGQLPPANLAGFRAVLRLEFLDCDQADVEQHGVPECVLCTPAQLQQLVDFVRQHHAAVPPLRLVVHCRMGSSRSAAVALIAHHLTECDFPRHPDTHHANRHVLDLAAAALGARVPAAGKHAGDEPHPYLPLGLQI